MLRQFVTASRADEHSNLNKIVLWIFVPNYSLGGVMSDIQNITVARSENE